jgi:hypothetical protein
VIINSVEVFDAEDWLELVAHFAGSVWPWQLARSTYPGPSAYSSLAQRNSDGAILLAYDSHRSKNLPQSHGLFESLLLT